MILKKKLFSLILFTFICIACTDHIDVSPISSWNRLNNFPGIARASATSFVYGNKGYVCLGRSGARLDFLKDMWEYNIITDSWKQLSDFPGHARVKAIAGVIGNKAYIGLGCISPFDGNQFNDLWEYDLQNDSWKQMASFPGVAKSDLFCVVIDSCIYTTLGFASTTFNSDTYKYNPKSNIWSKLKDFPVIRSSSAGFSIGNEIFVGTGFDTRNNKDFYCYNTATDSWKKVADVPEARILSKGVSINGKGYIMLGRFWGGNLDGGKLLDDIIQYDPILNKWMCCGDFPGGGRQNMVVFAINGKGYIIGGEDDVERKNDVWMFEP